MGQFFSAPVELALKYTYYDLRARWGPEGFRLLEQAVQEGDADTCCLLVPVPIRPGVYLAEPQFPRGQAHATLRTRRHHHRNLNRSALRDYEQKAGALHAFGGPPGGI